MFVLYNLSPTQGFPTPSRGDASILQMFVFTTAVDGYRLLETRQILAWFITPPEWNRDKNKGHMSFIYSTLNVLTLNAARAYLSILGHQFIPGLTYWHQTTTHTHICTYGQYTVTSEPSFCIFLDCGRKQEYTERAHAGTRRTSKLHTETPWLGIEPRTFCCEATVLSTAPLWLIK